MNIDLHTGARAFAMGSMSWDKVVFSPLFRVEQSGPKVKRGDWYLTKEGRWWVKYPTEECRIVVETARDRLSKERRFLFLEDAKSNKTITSILVIAVIAAVLSTAFGLSRMTSNAC
jgi:hypothetical protein